MKKNNYLKSLVASLVLTTSLTAQNYLATDFESFTLNSQSYYQDSTGADIMGNYATFQYDWDQSWDYWSGGFSYTNINDSTTSGSGNLYAAKAFTGYNNSSYYAMAQNNSIIKLSLSGPSYGFYITNSTFAFNSMRDGDAFAKKFGGPTGNDPDWFKLTVRAYAAGVMTTDSVEFYLADYRFSNNSQDYIVKDWQFVDLSTLPNADSLIFMLSSSDVGAFGMNTPAYFCMDSFVTETPEGIAENKTNNRLHVWPNPVNSLLNLSISSESDVNTTYKIVSLTGEELVNVNTKLIKGENQIRINLEGLAPGIYFLRLISGNQIITKKIVKE